MSRNHRRYLRRQRWAATRRRALDAAGWRCASCGVAGRLEVDHTRPLKAGCDPYDLGNLQVLCRRCHIEKTRAENRRELSAGETAWRESVRELADG